jgi:hypothetical protein
MLYRKQVRACALVLAPLIVAACGAENLSTPSFSQTTHIISSTGFGAAPSACHEFNNATAGAVTVFVTPPSIHLILRTGTCSAPGQTLVEKDIELVSVNAPAASNNEVASNPNPLGPETPYMLRLRYWQ